MESFQNQLTNWCKKNGMEQPNKKKNRSKPKKKPKTKETLSKRDIEELMGIRRPTYSRHRGSVKQK